MCGIAGFVSSRESAESRTEAIRRMCAAMVHRGPDDEGYATVHEASLGMRRLAIFDPAHGHQPMQTADGRYTLVFNGAIYNHRELRAELEQAGHAFKTHCDTEVLLLAYAHWQEKCLPRLRGMFAFAIWDDRERRLFAARDPLGIKPLYYASTPAGLLFASELNALRASRQVENVIDPAGVADYLARLAVPPPRTIYRGLRNLPPGHALVLDPSRRLSTWAWWHLPAPGPTPTTEKTYAGFVAGLRARLDDTVNAHRLADVPVGAFLSGGLDSSALVGLMARASPGRLKTFSVIFAESEYSEQAGAALVAKTFDTEHHEFTLTGTQVAADLPRILRTMDQPTGDGINTWYASQAARNGGVTAALSGLGSDELFGGYPSFRDGPRLKRLLGVWSSLPAVLRHRLLSHLRARGSTRALKLADVLSSARDLHEIASLRRRVLPESTLMGLLTPEARELMQRQGPHAPLFDEFVDDLIGADNFQILSAWELRTYMADVLLRDSDVCSMAHSLELRVPFADTSLLAWLWPQLARFKQAPGRSKQALADAVSDLLPPAILKTPKRGFTLPFACWMKHELRPFLEATFAPAALASCPWLDASVVQRLWQDFLHRHDPRAWSRVWTLAVLIAFANRKAG